MLQLNHLAGGPSVTVDANDSELIVRSFEVGYANFGNSPERNVMFFQRGPWRRQKATLSPSTLQGRGPAWSSWDRAYSEHVYSPSFHDMLKGIYPIPNVNEMSVGESIAIARDLAIYRASDNKQVLLMNMAEVGKRSSMNNPFRIHDGFNHSIMIDRLSILGIPVV